MKEYSFSAPARRRDAAIDGLRAVAILPVVLYHAAVAGFSGGFVGVDVFFVLSGYLIARVILADVENGRFSYPLFYERRIRRLLPALVVMAIGITLAAWLLLPPDPLAAYGKSLMAMTLFASNIYYNHENGPEGYSVAEPGGAQLLLHSWSLAVEAQFYLLFPPLLVALHRFAPRLMFAALTGIAFASFLLGAQWTARSDIGAFYRLAPRGWELLLGALLAIGSWPVPPRLAREGMVLCGLGLIMYAVTTFSAGTPFPGPNALYPCAGAWLALYSLRSGPSFAGAALGSRVPVFFGLLSYSLYLWHWPVLTFTRALALRSLTHSETALALAVSLSLAWVSACYIEAPFRGQAGCLNRRQLFKAAFGAGALIAVSGALLTRSDGFPQRFDAGTLMLFERNDERRRDMALVGDCSNYLADLREYRDATFCNVGDSPRRILLWGDSQMEQLFPLLKEMQQAGETGDASLVSAIAVGCPPSRRMNSPKRNFHCDRFTQYVLTRAREPDIDTVFLSFAVWWVTGDSLLCEVRNGECVRMMPGIEVRRGFLQELSGTIRELRTLGKRVVIALPFPTYNQSIPDLMIRNAMFHLDSRPIDITPMLFREQILAAAQESGAQIFDPRDVLCPEGLCMYESGGVALYRDRNHLAVSQTPLLRESLRKALSQ